MPLTFEPLSLERQAEYMVRLAGCTQRASDYSFVNMWGWTEEYGLEWAWEDDLVWIRQGRAHGQPLDTPLYWAPVGDWQGVDWQGRLQLLTALQLFVRVPKDLSELWSGTLGSALAEVEADRDMWDYLYLVEDLVELKGSKYHNKKNLLNQFVKNYPFSYMELTSDCVEEALTMQAEWCQWRECEDSPSLVAENTAIERVLESFDRLPGLLGGGLHVDGKMVAYTVAEVLDPETVVIHFEKGKPGFKGVYQAINQMFLERSARGCRLVNREQDLGDEGLRKAKLSYEPVGFLEKYRVRFQG